MRLIEQTPRKWTNYIMGLNPISESLVLLDSGGKRNWSALSDRKLVGCAQKFVDEKGIETRSMLAKVDWKLYEVLRKNGLSGQVRFKADERAWSRYADDELVAYAQRYADEYGIANRRGLERSDGGLYAVLWRRKLAGRIKFRGDERAWSRFTDDELVACAQRFVEENKLLSRSELRDADRGFYSSLSRRKLLGRLEFRSNRRDWKLYSDDSLVQYAQGYMEERGIRNSSGLMGADISLYRALRRRKLLGRTFTGIRKDENEAGLREIIEAVDEH